MDSNFINGLLFMNLFYRLDIGSLIDYKFNLKYWRIKSPFSAK